MSIEKRRSTYCKVTALILISLLMIGMLSIQAIPVMGQEALSRNKVTATSYYDRNPSVLIASDGKIWLTFSRTQTGSYIGHTCDSVTDYEVYYKTSNDGGATWSADNGAVANSGLNQFESAVVQGKGAYSDRIYIFYADRTNGRIKYKYTANNGATWSTEGDTGLAGLSAGSHFDAVVDYDGYIWVFFRLVPNIRYVYSDKGGTIGDPGWSSATVVTGTVGDNYIPKVLLDGSNFYVSFVKSFATGNIAQYVKGTKSGTTITWGSITQLLPSTSGIVHCDPVLFKDSAGDFWLLWAPWRSSTDTQWMEAKWSSDLSTWNGHTKMTTEDLGEWDYWPDICQYGNKLLMFYTSEESQGAIWMTAISTATNVGVAKFDQSQGLFEDFSAVAESTLPSGGKPSKAIFPFGFFSFKITGLSLGATVTLIITLPSAMPNLEYWKYGPTIADPTPHWYQIPIGDNDGDNIITITLQDGGTGDDDLMADGDIEDQGGPGQKYMITSSAVGGFYMPMNSLTILAPYLALVLLAGMIAAFFTVRRRR